MTYLHDTQPSLPFSLISALPHIPLLSEHPTLPLGRRIAGRYRLESLIRRGDASEIYRAFDENEGRPCAVKLGRRHARALDQTPRLRHDGIVEVRAAGRDRDGAPLLVMELLEGVDLEQLLAAAGALTLAQALPVLRGIAAALQFAHDRGVVHGDVTPAHVFLCAPRLRDAADGLRPGVLAQAQVKLLGFGPGRRGDEAPAYRSPEALQPGVALDGRADQWSLAVVAYQMLSGQRPLGAATPALCRVLRKEHPMPFTRLVPGLPMHVCAALDRALSRERSARFARVEELVGALTGPLPLPLPLEEQTTRPPLARRTARSLASAQAVPQFIPPERTHRTDAPRAGQPPAAEQDRTEQYSAAELQALLSDGGAAEPATAAHDDAVDAPTRKYDLALLDAVVRAEVARPARDRSERAPSLLSRLPTGPVRVTPPLPQGALGAPPADARPVSGPASETVQRIEPECTRWVRSAAAGAVSAMSPRSDRHGTVWFQPPTLRLLTPVRGPARLHPALVLLVCAVLLCAAFALCAWTLAQQ